MPRNSSGTYTAPVNSWNPPVEGTPIDPDDWIAQLADYEDAWTDSLSRTGEGGMLADLELDDNAILFAEITDPSSPAANSIYLYAKDNSTVTQLYAKDSAGTVTNLFNPTVTNIANSQLANMAQTTFKMRAAGAGTGSPIDGTAAQAITALAMNSSITFIIDGGGSAITTGVKGDLTIPFGCTITEWTLLADQSGSIVVDIWVDSYANYPPTVADTITGSAKPTISAATKGQSSTLTGWTTTITAGQTVRFNVDSITTCQRVTLSLKVTRTTA